MAWTTITNGTLPDADEVMGNFNSLIHRKVHTDATEYSLNSGTWTSQTSFTFGALNGILIGLNVKCLIKSSSPTGWGKVRIRITGSNLGTKYIQKSLMGNGSGNSQYATDTVVGELFDTMSTSYVERGISVSPGIKLLDASTTIHMDLKSDAAIGYLDEVQIEAVWTKVFTED